MDILRHPYREFEITIRGRVAPEYGGSGDFGWSDLAIEREVETSLGPVIGTPPNVEGAIDLFEKLQQDELVFEMIRLDLPTTVHNALVAKGDNG